MGISLNHSPSAKAKETMVCAFFLGLPPPTGRTMLMEYLRVCWSRRWPRVGGLSPSGAGSEPVLPHASTSSLTTIQ
ncbi:MAG: hypothetical protein ACREIQ_04645, partial [Nitrospiria bacterium]